ncbi:hypothetical protein [Methanobrevibacter sp.]|uniref:hypothetical protein n=1 Tax=Methanobrevibacter sp. TaxID=66852 RepID=UPI00388E1541
MTFSAVSATDNLDNQTEVELYTSVDTSEENLSSEVSDVYSSNTKTFTELNSLINDKASFQVTLDSPYKYDPNYDSNFKNGISITRSMIIDGNGYTIDGSNIARLFLVSNYVNFKNIIFINGNADYGGAIKGDNYYVTNSKFINNHATSDGGAMNGGYATFSTFERNTADGSGGACYSCNVEDCSFTDNYAKREGGAIYNTYTQRSTFIRNHADMYGGAMSRSSVSGSSFIDNDATIMGGAIFNAYAYNCTFTRNKATNGGSSAGISASADLCKFISNSADYGGAAYQGNIYNSIFKQNTAKQGGAMFAGENAIDCVFDHNTATEFGGALMQTYATRCNFTFNYAPDGGAMYHADAKNCNFFNNSAGNGGAMFNGYAVSSNFRYNTATSGGALAESDAQSSDFRYNSAKNGGAISGGSIVACTVISNTATEYGGGAYKSSSQRSLFRSNVAKLGGGIALGSASECTFQYNNALVSGGARFDAYVADSEFEGNTPVYKLYVSDFTGITGFGGDIKIQLYDSPNYPVTGVNATIKVYNSKNKLIGTYFSEVGYNWFVNFPSGKYKAEINIGDPAYELSALKININFLTPTSIYVASITTNYQAGKVLLVNLHDSAENVIKYAKVSVTLNGETKTYMTDDNGQAMIPTKTLKPGSYVASINFAGDATYIGSSATAKITVNKLTPKLTAPKVTFKLKDKTKKYVVTLKTNKNAAMKSVKITVKVNGKTYSAKTNSKGRATFKLTKLTKKGTFSATVKYAGNSIYKAVTKTVKLTVKR